MALALIAGAFALTGFNLVNGGLVSSSVPAYAEFANCGQGLHERGDVKLRGVLVGTIKGIEKIREGNCKVELGLFPESQSQIPANVGAQVRAKTIFGEKWVELLYPEEPSSDHIAENDVITEDRTIDPLEVETILNTALPLLESIDPENLSAALNALSTGFVGHEEAAIRGIESGIEALRPLNENEGLLNKGITQLAEVSKTFQNVDNDLFAALDRLDVIQRFTIDKRDLIAANFEKVPRLLDELTLLFTTRFDDFTRLVNSGATIIDILAARTGDLDLLLKSLPEFNERWIRNLGHNCRHRQGANAGEEVPGRCWRVHNIISETQGPYNSRTRPKPHDRDRDKDSDEDDPGGVTEAELEGLGIEATSDMGRLLGTPIAGGDDR